MIGGWGGAAVGATIGNAISGGGRRKTGGGASLVHIELPTSYGARLSDLRTQISGYGAVIPKVYGKMRLSGNIIWGADIKEIEHEKDEVKHSSNSVTKQKIVEYEYFASFAIAICQGPINEIIRIWVGDRLVALQELSSKCKSLNIYLGSSDQMPDSVIANYKPPGCCPAYRDLAYVVFEELALGDYDNRIPNFSFEVRREVRFRPSIEDKIKEIVLIPGAGEFVYSTIPNFKITGKYLQGEFTETSPKESVNIHNHERRANALVALDQMQKALPNLEWVALVVTWFATSSSARDCIIVPKVEYHDDTARSEPSEWSVAGLTRETAECVLKFEDESLTYGGTPSDDNVIAICRELRERGLKIMLYPMIFVDEIHPSPKPWRGRIKSSSKENIQRWFNGHSGYNNFIIHYANLTQDLIDAFVIGSEMIGLTSFTDAQRSYPAVDEFIKLARITKNLVGSNCIVTYAADWSEYHHTEGGWYNLDPLWACEAIDVVGIDSYFPLTEDLPASMITEELIKKGWEADEGWSYYWDWGRKKKHDLGKDYAWKDVEYWWKNQHRNPDGSITSWRPKMKPIWFTEMGFPSVDACSNQPNVFYDPSSIESFFPRGSKGRVDFFAQRQALNATLDFLKERRERPDMGNENLVAKSFIWTWDARPYPCWPDMMNIWQDGRLWRTGHWLNGKIGVSSLGAIIAEILSIAGFREDEYDVSLLNEDVEGFIVAENCSIREVIEQLKAAYFFDVIESDGRLKFIPREPRPQNIRNISQDEQSLSLVTYDELIVPSKTMASGVDNSGVLEINIAGELELPQRLSLTYIDPQQSYNYSSTGSSRSTCLSRQHIDYSLPIVMSNSQAKRITDIALYESWMQRMSFSFSLGPKYCYLEPADLITLTVNGVRHQIRITSLDISSSNVIKIQAHAHDVSIYDFYCKANYISSPIDMGLLDQVPDSILHILDIPYVPYIPNLGNDLSDPNRAVLSFACVPNGKNWQGAIIYMSQDGEYYRQLCEISGNSSCIVGSVRNAIAPPEVTYLTDYSNKIIAEIYMGAKLPTIEEQFAKQEQNMILVGDEIIIYKQLEKLQESGDITTYALSGLSRGLLGTSYACSTHKKDERFIFLGSGIKASYIDDNLIGGTLYFKAVSVGQSLASTSMRKIEFKAVSLMPIEPDEIVINQVDPGVNVSRYKDLQLTWLRQDRRRYQELPYGGIPMSEQQELYEIEIQKDTQIIRVLSSGQPSVIYSAAMQEEDELQKGEEYEVTIYQISSKVGRGYPAKASFTI